MTGRRAEGAGEPVRGVGKGGPSRRSVLTTAGLALGVAAVTSADSVGEGEVWSTGIGTLATVVAPPMPHVVMTALDVPDGAAGVAALSDLTRVMKSAGAVQASVGLGASWFEKTGLERQRPRGLTVMPAFTGDVLDEDLVHGDLLLQVCARSAEQARRVSAWLVDMTGGVRVRWRREGFRPEDRVEGGRALTRNLFGFVEGHGNPPRDGVRPEDVALVAAGSGEPGWAVGGSYQVVRIIRFAMRLWDADPVAVQEQVIGRHRDGRWLDGTPADRRPGFASDPHGKITPLDAHVRRANPRTPGVEAPRMLRRSFSFHEEPGQAADGLLFVAYQADLERGFAGVQRRLVGEPLGRYTLTVGGGYFFVPDLSRPLTFSQL